MIVIENLISAQEVASFQTSVRSLPFKDGGETAMGMAKDVKRNSQVDQTSEGAIALANRLLERMGNHATLVSAALPHKIFPPVFNRYQSGETYGYHVDAAIMRIPNSHEVLRSDVSMTLFLNEPDEYEGGELVIATQYGQQAVKLPAGSAVVYPSHSLHKVTEVIKGERLCAITWMQSMIPSAEKRESLFNLDQTIQHLSNNPAIQREELDKLHNVYHNLVRQEANI